MRNSGLLAFVAACVMASWGCSKEPLAPRLITSEGSSLAATRVSPSVAARHTLIVDDNRVECPQAEFTSIQAAVAAATPGDKILVCPGTYHEQVTVPKNDLTIAAKGAAEQENEDTDDDAEGADHDEHDVIVDAHGHQFGFLLLNTSGVRIEGFFVENAHEADIFLSSATASRIRRNVLTGAHHDGIEMVASNNNLIERNLSIDNLSPNACGINVAGGSSRNLVRHNKLVNNEWGIQIAGATTLDNIIRRNLSIHNRGNGIRNVGAASGTTIEKNRAFFNGLNPGPLTGAFAAGIRIANGTGILVSKNVAFDNLLFDLRNDAGPGATFDDNRCRTSSPPGLCEHDGDRD